eukprot:CAMPEP_0117038414 /NCGR_PEP_ID=MMETSP0472-20121206/27027_1 /TAXON_ID=693140 ORGANISM="Tiarina fusus, Strain LIS" /NCGR_SAMPLE_ID=MMETSP0472 /ASSEMBLY_ACC=CAM_ASM_000603 /LENGTH=138 /DNA_ID=CAMNT_0004748625 /DNA_START=29 /DNA_END=441 /DNA_ORIENTATION=+
MSIEPATSNNNNEGWKEIKGSDLLVRSIEQKRSNPLGSVSNDNDDDEDSPPKKIQSGDTILLNLIGRQFDSPDQIITQQDFDNAPTLFQDVSGWLVTVGEPHCLVRAVEYALEQALHEGETAYVFSTCKYNLGPHGIR